MQVDEMEERLVVRHLRIVHVVVGCGAHLRIAGDHPAFCHGQWDDGSAACPFQKLNGAYPCLAEMQLSAEMILSLKKE